MKRSVEKALDHLIAVHRIDSDKSPSKLLEHAVKLGLFFCAIAIVVKCAGIVFPDMIHVSSSVGGRELPIYCVETEEKKVALSFDAAWGNEDTRTILDILKKHDVHVTFFMTGGWVENYPDDVKAILAAGD